MRPLLNKRTVIAPFPHIDLNRYDCSVLKPRGLINADDQSSR